MTADLRALLRMGSMFAVALLFSVAGCSCTGTNNAPTLVISAKGVAMPPTVLMNGDTLTLADDEDPTTPAVVDVTITVLSTGLGVTDEVTLYDTATGDVELGRQFPDATGTVTFSRVVFAAGTYVLEARAGMLGGVRSPPLDITVVTSCATISFVTPAPPGGTTLTLGPSDDTDGMACGATFETTVVVSTDAGDGQPARIFVNGVPLAGGSTIIVGTLLTFNNVALDRRGASANTIAVEVDTAAGNTCRESFPADIFVDCSGVSCTITAPDTASTFLNSADDTSMAAGFQTNFDVTTDAEAVGENAKLIIDGNETGALVGVVGSVGMGGVASYGNVDLTEGTHTVQAECVDAAGNVTRSATASWTVDITPCGVSIVDVAGGVDPITDLDDVDMVAMGLQVDMTGNATGTDCTGLRVGDCASVGARMFVPLTADPWSQQFDLGSTAMQTLCAEVEDAAGNIGSAMVSVNVRTTAPQLNIVTPSSPALFNVAGIGGRTADADLGTPACDAAFTVHCTEVGVNVELVRQDTGVVLGTAPCAAMAGLPSPYAGQALFMSVGLPSLNDGTSYVVVARQTADRLTGLSLGLDVTADCDAPQLLVARPVCGSTLRPAMQDENLVTPEFEYRVDVLNNNTPKPAVDLEIRDSVSGTVGYTATSTVGAGPLTQFAGAIFAGGGQDVVACATDSAGNRGCAATCSVTVADLPTLAISAPAASAVLSMADDCDGATAGLQIRIQATTDGATTAGGGSATVQVGAAAPVPATIVAGVPANTIDVCVAAADARAVPVVVTVTDPVKGMVSAMVSVDIDTLPPTGAITDLTVLSVVNRRLGTVQLQWTDVADAGGGTLDRYELRCALTPITNETEWTAAPAHTVAITPNAGGSLRAPTISGFVPGTTVYCAVRAADIANAFTPLAAPASVAVTVSFLEQAVTMAASTGLGEVIAPIGDVNGDGVDDVLVGSTGPATYLYFGSSAGLASSPSVTIAGPGGGYGRVVAGLGDINGDTRPDFAVSARGLTGFRGVVYVFFGRPAASPWPASIDLTIGGCQADLCFNGGTMGALFGWTITALGDFNGDTINDFAVGAWRLTGRAFVILGSAGFVPGSTFDVPGATEPAGFYVDGPAGSANFGSGVAGVGTNLVIAARGDGLAPINGSAHLLTGRAYVGPGLQMIASTELGLIDTGSAGRYGEWVRNVGDYNGDGRNDIAVYEASTTGRVWVYLQAAGGTFSAASRLTVGNNLAGNTSDLFGNSMAEGFHPTLGALSDISRDMRADLLFGSDERGTALGSVDLFLGRAGASNRQRSAADGVLQPTSTAGSARRVAAFVGDVNGDGFPDIGIGDPAQTAGAGRLLIQY